MALRAVPVSRPRRASSPRLRVVRGAGVRQRTSLGVVLLLIVTVFCVAGVQAYVAQEGLRIAELERQVRKEEERLTLLRAKQAQLAAPSRIADEAAKLGMVTDENPTYLRGDAPERSTGSESGLRAAASLLKRSRR